MHFYSAARKKSTLFGLLFMCLGSKLHQLGCIAVPATPNGNTLNTERERRQRRYTRRAVSQRSHGEPIYSVLTVWPLPSLLERSRTLHRAESLLSAWCIALFASQQLQSAASQRISCDTKRAIHSTLKKKKDEQNR